jgi:hypothetical protein
MQKVTPITQYVHMLETRLLHLRCNGNHRNKEKQAILLLRPLASYSGKWTTHIRSFIWIPRVCRCTSYFRRFHWHSNPLFENCLLLIVPSLSFRLLLTFDIFCIPQNLRLGHNGIQSDSNPSIYKWFWNN